MQKEGKGGKGKQSGAVPTPVIGSIAEQDNRRVAL